MSRVSLVSAILAAFLITSPILSGCSPGGSAASSGAAKDLTRSQIDVLLAALAQAPSQGFQPGAFGETGLAERLKSDQRTARVQLRQAAIAYARAMHGEAIPKRELDPNWDLPRGYEAEADFTRAAREGRLEAWLKALPPASAQYEGLRQGYAAYQKIQAAGGWAPLIGTDLKPGASGPAVAALRQRLAVEDPAAAQAAAGDVYDGALAQAVVRAQQRYGLDPTGVLDKDTRAMLNVPVEARLGQIRANLERLRWLPRGAPPPERIEVNTAAGLVDVYRGGEVALHMRAAAGKPGDETPILVSRIETVVLNPAWNVPDQIAQNEILPKGPDYLQRMGFVDNATGGTMLTQQPGPENALGRAKFVFPNRYAVYLHDTPARSAFAREQRSVSHGCIRLERAIDLARLLASDAPGWSADRVDAVLAGQETTEVKLARPVPVTLMYLTAFPVAGGAIQFRQDVYEWDAEVLRRLDAAGPGHA